MYTRFKTLVGGPDFAGRATVGYCLAGDAAWTPAPEVLTPDGRGTGTFGALVSFPAGYRGPLLWSTDITNYADALFAVEEINPGAGEYLDAPLSTRASQATADALQAQLTVGGVVLAPGAFGLLAFDGVPFDDGWKLVQAAHSGEIRFDPGAMRGTVASPTNPNAIKQTFSTNTDFTERFGVVNTPDA